MRLAITGASGFLGQAIVRAAHARGHEIVAFSRTPEREVRGAIESRAFDFSAPPDLRGCEAVIHLAGEPILGLWTPAKQRAIRDSRVLGTRRIVEAIERAGEGIEVFVCASAVGYYADGGDRELDETAPAGTGPLSETCVAWEAEAAAAKNTRVVSLRIPPVLGRGDGMLPLMRRAFRFGLGAVVGSGAQWMPWIHVEDLARLTLFAVEDMNVRGSMNAVGPWPVRNADFSRTLARVLHRPLLFRIPAWAVRIALRGFAAELLESKRVVPAVATSHGFGFHFPELEPALRDLV